MGNFNVVGIRLIYWFKINKSKMFRDITIPKIPAKLTGTHSFIFWDWFNEWINEHLQINWLNISIETLLFDLRCWISFRKFLCERIYWDFSVEVGAFQAAIFLVFTVNYRGKKQMNKNVFPYLVELIRRSVINDYRLIHIKE